MVFVAATSRNGVKTQEQNNGNENPVLYGSLILTAAVFPCSFCCLAFRLFSTIFYEVMTVSGTVGLTMHGRFFKGIHGKFV